MKNTIIGLLLLLVAAIWYFGWSNTTKEINNTNTITTPATIDKHIANSRKKITTYNIPNTKKKQKNTINKKPTKHDSHSTFSPFEEEDIDFVSQKIDPIKGVEPISALRIKSEGIKNAKVGDTLFLPAIDGVVYKFTITERTISKRGSISINGKFEEDGASYSCILTQNKGYTFVTMVTPTGSYEAELIDGMGLMYLSSDIKNALNDYSKSDTIDPNKVRR